MSAYDYLSFEIRADSNRNEADDDSTRVGLVISSHQADRNFFSSRLDLGDQQRQWLPMRFSIPHMIREAGVGAAPWQTISRVQLFISESDYADGTELTFDIRNVKLLRFTAPVIERVEAPHYVMLTQRQLPVHFDVVGTRNVRADSHTITATLTDGNGRNSARNARASKTAQRWFWTLPRWQLVVTSWCWRLRTPRGACALAWNRKSKRSRDQIGDDTQRQSA